ncbi:MAG TPA: heme A synthase [Bacillales bacterium]|nr:heme A synthase [Bacillales bacterium]
MDRGLKLLAVLTAVGMLVVVIMGAIVTNTGSANGCGTSWPLCYGRVIPEQMNHKTWIELSHRVVSALLGMMVLALAVWSTLRLPQKREVKWLAGMSVFFIVLQGLLGGAAVIWQQSSFALALHFGFSIISFASVLLLAYVIFERLNADAQYTPLLNRTLRGHIYGLTLYTYAVVYSGAFVRHSGSAAGCGTSWPLCHGEWLPALTTPGGVQFIHRVAAGIVFLWTLYLLMRLWKPFRSDRFLRMTALTGFLLISAQVFTGALVVVSGLSLIFLLLHAFFITCYFGILCFLYMIALRAGRP